MQLKTAIQYFQKKFNNNSSRLLHADRWVGLEHEYPVVMRQNARGISVAVLNRLWEGLADVGWELIRDDVTSKIVYATRRDNNRDVARKFDRDVISIDTGYHTLELSLSPTPTLHHANIKLKSLIQLITSILNKQDAVLLGYGVQPVTGLGDQYISPKSRYRLYQENIDREKFSGEYESNLRYLGLSASAQTHIDIQEFEAINVVNMLNATAGLRIGLCANSPVWGKPNSCAQVGTGSRMWSIVRENYDATRELFWDWSWPSRKSQIGIPPRFQDIEHYINYLMDFRTFVVKRNDQFFRLDNHKPYRKFFENNNGEWGISAKGIRKKINPCHTDVHILATTAWFNARLHSTYGTVEDRSVCQQPPNAQLAPAALVLGLIENLEDSLQFSQSLSLDQWRDIREIACKSGLNKSKYPGVDLVKLTEEMLDISTRGLKKRNLREEQYLLILYERLASKLSLADEVRNGVASYGIEYLLTHNDMLLLAEAENIS